MNFVGRREKCELWPVELWNHGSVGLVCIAGRRGGRPKVERCCKLKGIALGVGPLGGGPMGCGSNFRGRILKFLYFECCV